MKNILIFLWAFMLAVPAWAQGNYRIQPGDTIAVEVLEDSSLNRSLLVLPDGTVNFPFAGSLRAGGRTASQVQRAITQGIASNFAADPTVFVTVNSIAPQEEAAAPIEEAPETIDVYFTGEVNAPGLKPMQPGTTFLQAIAQSGGFTRFAALKRVQLRRNDPQTGQSVVYNINYKALSDGARLNQNIILQDGDVILAPERRLFE